MNHHSHHMEKEDLEGVFCTLLSKAATVIEIVLGLLFLIACAISSVGLVANTDYAALMADQHYLQNWLSVACIIIIGIELIKMITSYSIDSVVDVMLLAVARQMILAHAAPLENLITVIAVGVLFVIRKYLYVSHLDKPQSRREMEEHIRAQLLSGALGGEDGRARSGDKR